MRIGVTFFLQNYRDWERFESGDTARPPDVSDASIYDEELRLGRLVEPLGFDSMWTVEHHFSPVHNGAKPAPIPELFRRLY